MLPICNNFILTYFQSSFVKFCDEKVTSQLTETVLNQSEGGSDMFPLVIDKASDQPVALGVYTLQWSRLGTSEITSSSVTMPTIMYVSLNSKKLTQ